MIRSDTGYTLQWTSDDGSFQINLRLIAEYIVIETNASTEKEKVQAMVGSYTIYEQITNVMQSRLRCLHADHQDARAVNCIYQGILLSEITPAGFDTSEKPCTALVKSLI